MRRSARTATGRHTTPSCSRSTRARSPSAASGRRPCSSVRPRTPPAGCSAPAHARRQPALGADAKGRSGLEADARAAAPRSALQPDQPRVRAGGGRRPDHLDGRHRADHLPGQAVRRDGCAPPPGCRGAQRARPAPHGKVPGAMPAQRLLLWQRRGARQAPAARAGRGPVDPANGGIGNAILRFPLDLSAVEDYFIPANGLFLDNVRAAPPPRPLRMTIESCLHACNTLCRLRVLQRWRRAHGPCMRRRASHACSAPGCAQHERGR
jgi:hypothetical protein